MADVLVDLRSDTVTRPTPAMRAAIASAEVGDDQFGDDPTVRALEEEVADRFGHEAAVFVPSGTMGNNIAIRLIAERSTELLCDSESHIVSYEVAGVAALGGIQTRTLESTNGILSPAVVASHLRAEPVETNYSMVRTSAVAIENTHVRSGGRAWRLNDLDAIVRVVEPFGVALHCDGARIWNASVATGISLSTYGSYFQTLSVCLSKGLGAPVGSLVVTDRTRAVTARVLRRQLGGAMRRCGLLAAAGIYALEHHFERLADDHLRAKNLATAIEAVAPGQIDAASMETNIVLFNVNDANAFAAAAAERGVLVGAIAPRVIRAVLHLDVDDHQLDTAINELSALLSSDH